MILMILRLSSFFSGNGKARLSLSLSWTVKLPHIPHRVCFQPSSKQKPLTGHETQILIA